MSSRETFCDSFDVTTQKTTIPKEERKSARNMQLNGYKTKEDH